MYGMKVQSEDSVLAECIYKVWDDDEADKVQQVPHCEGVCW